MLTVDLEKAVSCILYRNLEGKGSNQGILQHAFMRAGVHLHLAAYAGAFQRVLEPGNHPGVLAIHTQIYSVFHACTYSGSNAGK